MTPDEARERVKKIEKIAWDFEQAHSKEDELYLDFMRFVRDETTDDNMREVAVEVLRATFVEFPRYAA